MIITGDTDVKDQLSSADTDENKQIADFLIDLTQQNKNWGFGLCFLSLRNVLGLP